MPRSPALCLTSYGMSVANVKLGRKKKVIALLWRRCRCHGAVSRDAQACCGPLRNCCERPPDSASRVTTTRLAAVTVPTAGLRRATSTRSRSYTQRDSPGGSTDAATHTEVYSFAIILHEIHSRREPYADLGLSNRGSALFSYPYSDFHVSSVSGRAKMFIILLYINYII